MNAVAPKNLPQWVRDLLASGPPAAGEGVNLWLFRMARVLHPYRGELEIANILRASVADCGRVVTEQEIVRAVANSKSAAWHPDEINFPVRAPAWPSVNQEHREAVIRDNGLLVDLWEASPHLFDDSESHTEWLIDQLFPSDPLLCVGETNSSFCTRAREELRGKLSAKALIVPSPMSARTGITQDGKVSEHTKENTGPRRFLIVEQDAGTVDEQAADCMYLLRVRPSPTTINDASSYEYYAGKDGAGKTPLVSAQR
jgi:hypothetical protein